MSNESGTAGGIAPPAQPVVEIDPVLFGQAGSPAGLASGVPVMVDPTNGAIPSTNFILYQPTPSDQLERRLGEADYSYYFVMREFHRILERLGRVHVVEAPESEVDALYDELSARGETALFICFAPPHRCPVDLRCPTTSVLAWEFESIPDEQWGEDPRTDWRYVFGRHGRAITLSKRAANLVRQAMGVDFPVAVIPVPVWDRFAAIRERNDAEVVRGRIDLEIQGIVLDGQQLCDVHSGIPELRAEPWTGDSIEVDFRDGVRSRALLDGFYASESWGAWTRTAMPSITLPVAVSGPVRVRIDACAFGANVARPLRMEMGGSETVIVLGQARQSVEVDIHPEVPTNVIRFTNLDLTPVRGFRDPRSMGIGFTSLRIERGEGSTHHDLSGRSRAPMTRLKVDGVIYTSVLNPLDGRKNWEDILTAFVWAFRDRPDAVLVLKMTHHDIYAYLNDLRAKLRQLTPFACGIFIIHAFLDDEAYGALMSGTTYYVNASRGEGLCIPLTEFMSCGKPAIAPMNTAMLDYLNGENGFPVRCWRMHNAWPPDPRHVYRTTWHRIDWASLLEAYRSSYRIATGDPGVYLAKGRQALATMERHSSDDVVAAKLATFVRTAVPTR